MQPSGLHSATQNNMSMMNLSYTGARLTVVTLSRKKNQAAL
ncbi:hypothetical protein BH24ACT21_BH24ACT21_07630 [soil metagenome]